jgi:hypothetical protein
LLVFVTTNVRENEPPLETPSPVCVHAGSCGPSVIDATAATRTFTTFDVAAYVLPETVSYVAVAWFVIFVPATGAAPPLPPVRRSSKRDAARSGTRRSVPRTRYCVLTVTLKVTVPEQPGANTYVALPPTRSVKAYDPTVFVVNVLVVMVSVAGAFRPVVFLKVPAAVVYVAPHVLGASAPFSETIRFLT